MNNHLLSNSYGEADCGDDFPNSVQAFFTNISQFYEIVAIIEPSFSQNPLVNWKFADKAIAI